MVACLVSGRYSDAPVVTGVIMVAVVIISGIVLGVIYGSRHFGRISCETFGEQTRRETRFVIYNSWAVGDCLTPTADGKWISTSALREFGETP